MIESVKIDSSQGEPFYAEIPFSNAQSQKPVEVAIEQHGEISSATTINPSINRPSYFNTYVRQNPQGEGVIIITSSRPIQERNIQLLLKITDGNQIRLQQIRSDLPNRMDRLQAKLQGQPLQPKYLLSEQDIELNLPVVAEQQHPSRKAAPLISAKQVISINRIDSMAYALPSPNPETSNARTNPLPNTASPVMARSNPTPPTTNSATNTPVKTDTAHNVATTTPHRNAQQGKNSTQAVAATKQATTVQSKSKPKTQSSSKTNKATLHTVKAKESLWSISSKISELQNIPISLIMQQIRESNPSAFINNDPNYLRQGAILEIPGKFQVIQPKSYAATHVKQIDQIKNKPKPPAASARLEKAHMSIVSSSKAGEVQGGDKLTAAERRALQSLSEQILTQRNITFKLQGQVRELDEKLQLKERRITVVNARLAELEKQLKAKKTSGSVQSPKS